MTFAKLFRNISLPKVHFIFAGLIVANLLQYKHTASRFDALILTKIETHELFK